MPAYIYVFQWNLTFEGQCFLIEIKKRVNMCYLALHFDFLDIQFIFHHWFCRIIKNKQYTCIIIQIQTYACVQFNGMLRYRDFWTKMHRLTLITPLTTTFYKWQSYPDLLLIALAIHCSCPWWIAPWSWKH